MKRFLVLLTLCLLPLCADARLRFHGGLPAGGAGGLCAFGVSGDGCTANQTESTSGFVATGPPVSNTNTVQHTDFFTGSHARQSGQSWGNTTGTACTNTNCHPPWNVAGVDYPVGIQSSFPATLCGSTSSTTLCDPSTATLPAGCTYCPANNATSPCVGIDRQEVACAGHASYDFEGYDFSATSRSPNACVALDINSSTGGGTLTIKNNKFGNTAGCYSPTHHNFSTVFSEGNPFATINFSYNLSNGNGNDATANTDYQFTVDLSDGANIIVTYNALISSVSQPLLSSPSVNGSTTILYNYLEGVPCANAAHCHFTQLLGGGVNVTNVYHGYNTYLSNNGDFGGTAMDWTDGVATNSTLTNWNQYNNVMVENTLGSSVTFCGGQCIWVAILLNETSNITNANVKNNYFDSTGWGGSAGPNQCMEIGSGTNTTGTITNTSPTISSITTTNYLTNMFLYAATGIPANTTASTIGANSITMSANATASTTETIYGAVNPLPTFTMSGNINMLTGKTVNSLTQDLTNGAFTSGGTVGTGC